MRGFVLLFTIVALNRPIVWRSRLTLLLSCWPRFFSCEISFWDSSKCMYRITSVWYVLRNADSAFIVRCDEHFVVWSSYTHWNSLLYWRIMLFITKLYHRTKYLFNKKKRIENLQWIVIGVRRRSRVRFIPSIETTTKTKDTAETETISPWSSKHSNNTRQYESSSSRPSYVLIVNVGFRALEHLYLSESFLKCCM